MSDVKKKLENFEKALVKLKDGTKQYDSSNDLTRDGLIQRFEFTFELAWKTLKIIFEEEGVLGLNSPKLVLKEAYSADIIQDQSLWLNMLSDRNATSHIYSESLAIEICDRIINCYEMEFERVGIIIRERLVIEHQIIALISKTSSCIQSNMFNWI